MLQDFLIVEELPDRLPNGLINFQKMRRAAGVLARLKRHSHPLPRRRCMSSIDFGRYQTTSFPYRPVKEIQEYLLTGPFSLLLLLFFFFFPSCIFCLKSSRHQYFERERFVQVGKGLREQ
jgi:hypothetical protein